MPLPTTAKPSAWRSLRLILLTVALAVPIAAAVLWWRDRPLAEVARSLEAPGGSQRALDAVEVFLARHPAHERALALKGRALVELGRWEEASEIFAQVGVDTPEEMRAWAIALVNQRRFSQALPLLERLLKAEPNDPVLLRHITTCRFQSGLALEALESAAKLGAIDGHEVEGLFVSGVIHRARGSTSQALESWARIEAVRPDAQGLSVSPAEFFLIYGEDFLSEGMPRMASLTLRKSQEHADNLAVELQLGKAWSLTGDTPKAALAWKRALERDPDNEAARQGLAEIALAGDEANEALAWLAPIADRPDVSSDTAYLMERAHTMLGNADQLEHWQRRTSALREGERRHAALERRLRDRP